MFDKFKRKIWKSLTKSIIKDSCIQQRIYSLEWEASSLNQIISGLETSHEKHENLRILCTGGYTYSGSSAIIGLLNEFDNVSVIGNTEPAWSKSTRAQIPSECLFFLQSHFFEMLDSYHQGNQVEQSFAIIQFIKIFQQAYETKRSWAYEYLPQLYNQEFLNICNNFLLNTLLLNESAYNIVKSKGFPTNAGNAEYEHCNFIEGNGKHRYLHYQFKRMNEAEFFSAVQNFLNSFFLIINGKRIVAYDRLLKGNRLEKMNQYLSIPAKQVCVYRDPRDRFVAAQISGTYFSANASDYVKTYRRAIENTDSQYEHRLMIRFEDLVLRYDETVQKIISFFGLDPQNHVAPKSVFDPAISVANIGAWRSYVDQDFMREIEELMGDYCYYPEREKLSDESLALLRSSGNWSNL